MFDLKREKVKRNLVFFGYFNIVMPLSDTAVKDTEKIISVRDMIAWLATLPRFRPNPKFINLEVEQPRNPVGVIRLYAYNNISIFIHSHIVLYPICSPVSTVGSVFFLICIYE